MGAKLSCSRLASVHVEQNLYDRKVWTQMSAERRDQWLLYFFPNSLPREVTGTEDQLQPPGGHKPQQQGKVKGILHTQVPEWSVVAELMTLATTI
jgi:hypothetical protein